MNPNTMHVTSQNKQFVSKTHYPTLLAKIIDYCGGVGHEMETSTDRCASALGVSEKAVADLRKVAARVGGLEARYVGGPKGKGGRNSYWTFTHDAKWIEDEFMKQFGLQLRSYDIDKRMRPVRQPSVTEFAPDAEGVLTPLKQIPETQIAQQLRPLRKSEPEALIEAARQYMGREAFIKEELERFAKMGITIDESAIKVEKDPVLEAISGLVGFIDNQKAAIDRQAEALDKLQKTGAITRKTEQLQKDLSVERENTAIMRRNILALQQEHRVAIQKRDRRIQELENELRTLATHNLRQVAAVGH